jgi:hypothetical protein
MQDGLLNTNDMASDSLSLARPAAEVQQILVEGVTKTYSTNDYSDARRGA